jgi:hypothetical protein
MNAGTPIPRWLRPSIGVALGAWLVYTLAVNAVQLSAGVPYPEWFTTAPNAWRVGVLSLMVGSALLMLFVRAAHWPDLWRDPVRLPVTPAMKVAMVAFWVSILVRLAGARWSEVPVDLLLAIVASGVLVGFAEETLFRGIFLRCMREGGRNEAAAATWTAACFGLFHLPNVFMGTGWIGLLQVLLAAVTGLVLYVFRRNAGVLWPAMVAHGAWDISAFLAVGYAQPWLAVPSLAIQLVMLVLGIAVLVSLQRHDRGTIVVPR